MQILRLKDGELAHLIRMTETNPPPGEPQRVVQVSMGPGGGIDLDNPSMLWAIKEIHRLRFPDQYLTDGAGI